MAARTLYHHQLLSRQPPFLYIDNLLGKDKIGGVVIRSVTILPGIEQTSGSHVVSIDQGNAELDGGYYKPEVAWASKVVTSMEMLLKLFRF